MVERYGEWDKHKARTFKHFPWWKRHSGVLVKSSIAVIFIFTFGNIYKLLWFPPREVQLRSFDPLWGEDKGNVLRLLKQREDALVAKKMEEEALQNKK